MNLQPLSEGRVVRILVEKNGTVEQRAARVVRAWSDTRANLIIDLDGPNDVGAKVAGWVNDRNQIALWIEQVELVDGQEAAAKRLHEKVCFWPPGAPSAKKIDPLLSMTPGGSVPPGAQCMDGPMPPKGGFTPRTGDGPGKVGAASFDDLPVTPVQRPPGHSER